MTDLNNSPLEFEPLLQYLKRNRGFDFTGYKRNSVMRRVEKRMSDVGAETYAHYADYLEVHPEEFPHLLNTILINVTAFFRDPAAWDYIRDEVIPRILASKEPDDPVRVWSAGCASGAEAYSLAMLLAEAVGFDRFPDRVQIYATDIDEEALAEARRADYTAREVVGVPQEYIDRYFERSAAGYTVHKDLRRVVVFGRHDLLQDAPVSQIDLLVCRNAIMYFNAEIQAKILAHLHFALNDAGYLFLGKAEMLFQHSSLFTPVDLKLRIFSKVTEGAPGDRLLQMAQPESNDEVSPLTDRARMRELAFETSPAAQIVLDLSGLLTIANERARRMFRLTSRDMNRPLQDLEISCPPLDLRSCLEQAYSERLIGVVKDVPWSAAPGEPGFLDVQVAPLQDTSGSLIGAAVTFTDVTPYQLLQGDLAKAYEELQATNEELKVMNEEMRRNGGLLSHASALLNAVLSSMRGGVVVMNSKLEVQSWNSKADELWGLSAKAAQSKYFFSLDIGLPIDRLKQSIQACLSGGATSFEDTIEAANRRGKAITCKVTCTTLVNGDDLYGVIMVME